MIIKDLGVIGDASAREQWSVFLERDPRRYVERSHFAVVGANSADEALMFFELYMWKNICLGRCDADDALVLAGWWHHEVIEPPPIENKVARVGPLWRYP